MNDRQGIIKILFLAANPKDSARLQIDEEMRAVDQALRKSEYRDRFDLRSHWAVQFADLQELLLRYQPHIVHFSGHGSPQGEIVLHSERGMHPVSAEALSALFTTLKDNVCCVVLNACYSQIQAQAIATHIDCVIGMSAAIGDTAALNFASAFYLALGFGRNVKEAFDLGCNAIDLANMSEADIPRLLALHKDPVQVTVVLTGLPASVVEPSPLPAEPPFKGLQFFDMGDANIFFGREQLTAELVTHLCKQRFLAVVGASGSGKSSLVRAGLVPALQRTVPRLSGVTPPAGSDHWPIHIITPTVHPLKSLAASLTRDSESVTATTTLIDDLSRDARSLDLSVNRILSRQTTKTRSSDDCLLLIVDQFEELFTLCRETNERKAFVENLLTAAEPDGQTFVVLTLRADFYAHCSEFARLRTALERYQRFIGPMKSSELRQAIEEPARLGHWDFEPGLVDLMLEDVGNEPGALPLLSHALLETWQRRHGRTLTFAGYTAAGRVQGAIAETANRVFAALDKEQQRIARNIFLRLTELGEGAQDTRGRVVLDELIPTAAEKPMVVNVLMNFDEQNR